MNDQEIELSYCHLCCLIGTPSDPLVRVALPSTSEEAKMFGIDRTETRVHIGCWLFRQAEHIERSYLNIVVHKKEDSE